MKSILNNICSVGLLTLLMSASSQAQDGSQRDPYKLAAGAKQVSKTNEKNRIGKNIRTVVEVFSLPVKEAATLIREGKSDQEVYQHLKTKAKLEDISFLTSVSGDSTRVEAVREVTYPTEYDLPQIPDVLGVQVAKETKENGSKVDIPEASKLSKAPTMGALNGIATPSSPTAFEMRPTGLIWQILPHLYVDNDLVAAELSLEFVTHVGKSTHGQGLSEVEMPEFEKQKIRSKFVTKLNTPYLVGSLNRYKDSELEGADRTWFVMLTLKLN